MRVCRSRVGGNQRFQWAHKAPSSTHSWRLASSTSSVTGISLQVQVFQLRLWRYWDPFQACTNPCIGLLHFGLSSSKIQPKNTARSNPCETTAEIAVIQAVSWWACQLQQFCTMPALYYCNQPAIIITVGQLLPHHACRCWSFAPSSWCTEWSKNPKIFRLFHEIDCTGPSRWMVGEGDTGGKRDARMGKVTKS